MIVLLVVQQSRRLTTHSFCLLTHQRSTRCICICTYTHTHTRARRLYWWCFNNQEDCVGGGSTCVVGGSTIKKIDNTIFLFVDPPTQYTAAYAYAHTRIRIRMRIHIHMHARLHRVRAGGSVNKQRECVVGGSTIKKI